MTTKLLIENAPFTLKLEEQASASGTKYVVRGQFARSDKPTQNKRLYKEHLWTREISRLNEAMIARRAFGELDHPADGRTKLQRVSHLMTNLRVEGGEIVGDAEILDTPNGRILKALFQAGAQVGVSSRGYGSTKTVGDIEEVQEDFRLDTFDFVADPATQTAYPKVFQEEREHMVAAEKDMTLESLQRDYAGLISALSEQKASEVNRLIAEADERAERRLEGRFTTQLRRTVETIAEEAHRKARSEMESDPEVAGAKRVIEDIVSLVAPFGLGQKNVEEMEARDKKIAALEAKLAERELEIQAQVRESEEAKRLSREASFQLCLERLVSAHPSRDTVVKLMGDLSGYKSVQEMEERAKVILKEFEGLKPKVEDRAVLEKELEEAKAKIAALEADKKKAIADRDDAKAKTIKAVKVAEDFQRVAHLERKIGGRRDADRLRTLAEDAESIEEIDRIVEQAGIEKNLNVDQSDEAKRIRERLQRGKANGLTEDSRTSGGANANGSQDVSGILESVGTDIEEFDRLSGVTQPR